MSRPVDERIPYEALSRLAAGDLPEAEAEALRRRIALEPRVARAWDELSELVRALRELPEEAPPRALDEAVLGRSARSVPRRWALAAAGLGALAAAVWAAVLIRGAEPAEVVLEAGASLVDGAVLITAGALPVRVDGRVRISVEPGEGLARGPGAIRVLPGADPEDPMDRIVLGAGAGGALVGALVTVAVYQGTAEVSLPEGPVMVEAGQTRQFSPERRAAAGGAPSAEPGSVEDQIAALEAENAVLREQLAEARFTGAVARGQVAATQGQPVPWTDDVPAALRPEAFEALLREEVAKLSGFEIQAIDCSEYPCIATLRAPTGDGWQDATRQLAEGVSSGLGDDVGTWMGLAVAETDAGTTGGVGLAFAPGEDMKDDEVRTRLDWRAQGMLKDLEHDLDGGADGGADGGSTVGQGEGSGGEQAADAIDILEHVGRRRDQNGQ